MLSELQSRKLEHFFGVFDGDGDGYLEQSDFETLVTNMASVRGATPGMADYDDLRSLWMFTWEALDKVADTNRDNLVSPTEWTALADQLLGTEEGYNMVMNAIGLRTFDVLDVDGDGQLTVDDWRQFFGAHKLSPEAAEQVFQLLDSDGDGRLSRAETMDRLREFFYSADPDAPGNSFFGPLTGS